MGDVVEAYAGGSWSPAVISGVKGTEVHDQGQEQQQQLQQNDESIWVLDCGELLIKPNPLYVLRRVIVSLIFGTDRLPISPDPTSHLLQKLLTSTAWPRATSDKH